MHHNTFLKAPKVLTSSSFWRTTQCVFCGQITGFEGYMESAASGLLAARQIYARLQGRELPPPPGGHDVRSLSTISRPRTRTSSRWART